MPNSESSSPDLPVANPIPWEAESSAGGPATPGNVALDASTPIYRLFVGPHGVRALWRLLVYLTLCALFGWALSRIVGLIPPLSRLITPNNKEIRPDSSLVGETLMLLVVLIPAVIMGRLERRTLGDYGLPNPRRHARNFWSGFFWGLVLVSVVVGAIALFHGYSVSGIALSGAGIPEYGLAWLLVFLLVGLFEEFSFRGYTLYTLASGIRFWPAAVVLSALFGASHLSNSGEALVGAAQVFFIAMFFCLTLRRTGSLWFAIGAHASFDWGETYLYSVPNSGLTATGHLLASSLHGPDWITGGAVGPEGSVFCFVFVAVSFIAFDRLYPRAKSQRQPAVEPQSTSMPPG